MRFLAIVLALLGGIVTQAQTTKDSTQRINFHFQTTYIYQYKPSFHSPYSGTNSLKGEEEKQNSLSATLYLGARLWKGAAVFINPEIVGGSGLTGAVGMGASSNGETFRVGNPEPTLFLGRAYLQQTFALKGGYEDVDDAANQLRGKEPKNFVRVLAGKFCLGDIFDNNDYSNAPRTQFLNWAFMNNGAWDYAADVRGYTYSVSAMLQLGNWGFKAGAATLPKTANGDKLNTNLSEAIALNAQIERGFSINNRPGSIKVLAFRNRANMGNYDSAIKMIEPDVTATREFGRTKYGFGVNFSQQTGKYTGLFARAGWNDGRNETWCFTEIDQNLSAGILINGGKWKRDDDELGIATTLGGLSKDHREYLKLGGDGFILGDGTINYAIENVTEIYYKVKPFKQYPIWFSGDYQFVLNPGYNKDRGPVNILSARFHVEF
ncbi:carbohydrate porin [Chitinophagaceae bacterium 26-R-25]|nr:carbohydrate porin [Chitinophagaceae bacterium 26-R-25]